MRHLVDTLGAPLKIILPIIALAAGCTATSPEVQSPSPRPTAAATPNAAANATPTATLPPDSSITGTPVRVNDNLHRVFPEDHPEQVLRYGADLVASVIAAFEEHDLSQENGALILDFLHENEFRIPDDHSVVGFDEWGIEEFEQLAAQIATDKQRFYNEGLAILNQFIPSAVEQLMDGVPGVTTIDEQQISHSAAIFFTNNEEVEFMETLGIGLGPPLLTQQQKDTLLRQYFFVKGEAASEQQKQLLFDTASAIVAREWRQKVTGQNPFATLAIDLPGEPYYEYAVQGTNAWESWMDIQSRDGMRPDSVALGVWFDSHTAQLVDVYGPVAQTWVKARNGFIQSGGNYGLALVTALLHGEISQHTFDLITSRVTPPS